MDKKFKRKEAVKSLKYQERIDEIKTHKKERLW